MAVPALLSQQGPSHGRGCTARIPDLGVSGPEAMAADHLLGHSTVAGQRLNLGPFAREERTNLHIRVCVCVPVSTHARAGLRHEPRFCVNSTRADMSL